MTTAIEAGFGRVDITPRVGVELAGYGPFLNRCSERVLEPIYARALAVRNGGQRWVLVSCDLMAVGATVVQQIRTLVCRQTSWQAHEIMIHATHTHSAPCTVPELIGWGEPDPLYMELLPRHIAKACIDAIEDLQPATFFHSEVAAVGFGYNRELPSPARSNAQVLEGKWITDLPEATDTTAQVIRVERQDRVVGFITYFSCHPVIAGANNREIHGDFVGIATNLVERHYPGTTGIFLQGAMGDINSNFVHGEKEETLRALEDFSNRFSRVILQGLQQAQPIDVTEVQAWLGDAPCQLDPLTDKQLQDSLDWYEGARHEAHLSASDSWTRMTMVYTRAIQRLLNQARTENELFPVQSFSLGPISFTGLPMELMHRSKQHFQAKHGSRALLLSVTNGFMGYAALRECYAKSGNYAAYVVPYILGRLRFTPAIEDEVLQAALTGMVGMRATELL